jgi:hypothetical protein
VSCIGFFCGLTANLKADASQPNFLDNKNIRLYKAKDELFEHRFYLPRGLYLATETLLIPSNTLIHGDGPETIIATAPHFKGDRLISNAAIESINVNIYLKSFKVIFDLQQLPGDIPGVLRFENVVGLTIESLEIETNTKYYAIDLSAGIKKATIHHCTIENIGGGGGIQVRNRSNHILNTCENISILDNTITSVNDEPIAVFGWLGRVSNVRVENNTITANGASFGITAYGTDKPKDTGRLQDVIIRHNTVTGSRNGAIAVKGGANSVRIESNQIHRTNNDGLFFEDGGPNLLPVKNIVATGNTIDDSGRHGIYAKGLNIMIEGNLIGRSKGAGVFISGKGGGRVDVLNNRISGPGGKSIIVSHSDRGRIAGNLLRKPDDILRIEK